jgi:16S rRNA C967 or C1407 C5-methylase (RsmB/RsmF family)
MYFPNGREEDLTLMILIKVFFTVFKNLGKHLIRTLPKEDKTIGFFVAVFRRKDS